MKIIIISPHIDDAIISLGGSCLNWRKKDVPVTVYNFFTRSNFTKEGFGKVVKISEIRKNEDLNIFKQLGIECRFLGYSESVLRGYKMEHNPDEYPNKFDYDIDRPNLENICQDILSIIESEKDSFFFFPMGIGNHVDHLCITKAVEKVLQKTKLQNYAFYEELPYVFKHIPPKKLIAKYSLQAEKNIIDIEEKVSYIKQYESQPVDAWLEKIIKHAENIGENNFMERCWFPSGKK